MPQHQVPSESLQCVQADIAQNVAFDFLRIVYRPLGMWEPTCPEGTVYLVHWGKYENRFSSRQLLPAYFLAEVFFLTKIGRAKYLVCQAGMSTDASHISVKGSKLCSGSRK